MNSELYKQIEELIGQLEKVILCPNVISQALAAVTLLKIENSAIHTYRHFNLQPLHFRIERNLIEADLSMALDRSDMEAMALAELHYWGYLRNLKLSVQNIHLKSYLTKLYLNGHSLTAWSLKEIFGLQGIKAGCDLPLRPLNSNMPVHNIVLNIRKILFDSHYYAIPLQYCDYEESVFLFTKHANWLVQNKMNHLIGQVISSYIALGGTNTGTYNYLYDYFNQIDCKEKPLTNFEYTPVHETICLKLLIECSRFEASVLHLQEN